MTNETTVVLLAGIAFAELVVIALLLGVVNAGWKRHQRAIDRLLILGKSATPGEAVASYERLARIERARADTEEKLARAAGQRVHGAEEPGADVARKTSPGGKWFGFRSKPPKPAPKGG